MIAPLIQQHVVTTSHVVGKYQWFPLVHELDYQDRRDDLNTLGALVTAHHRHVDQRGDVELREVCSMRERYVHNVVQRPRLQGCASPVSSLLHEQMP